MAGSSLAWAIKVKQRANLKGDYDLEYTDEFADFFRNFSRLLLVLLVGRYSHCLRVISESEVLLLPN